jgi:diacylglycerol kinase
MSGFFKGFQYAANGIIHAVKTQRNMKFHLSATLAVVTAGLFFHISTTEWIFILFCIALVISAEIFNTSLEALTDLATQETNSLAKIAKDCAAGAVLVISVASSIIGLIIFIPYILQFIL